MDKFEEAICEHNPLYKEGLQDKYYQGAKWAWQSRQAEVLESSKRIEDLKELVSDIEDGMMGESKDVKFIARQLKRILKITHNQK